MLRVGLTGGLGSGKSTVGEKLARRGAYVLEADEIGRELMQPGQQVYAAIAEHFGEHVVRADGLLDRAKLARIAFGEGRVEELNAIVHPAVIERQREMSDTIASRDPGAVVVVESALIFETRYGEARYGEIGVGEIRGGEAGVGGTGVGETGGGWRGRFDLLILVTASEATRLARYVRRQGAGKALGDEDRRALEAEGRRRLRRQIPDEDKVKECDYVLRNEGSIEDLEVQVVELWERLLERSRVEQRA